MSRELMEYPKQKQPISRLGGYAGDLEDTDERDHHLVLRIESWFGKDFEINFWDAGSQQFVAKSLTPQHGRIPNTIAPVFSM